MDECLGLLFYTFLPAISFVSASVGCWKCWVPTGTPHAPAYSYLCCILPCLQTKPCDLAVAQEIFGPNQQVIGLPKNSTLTRPLTLAMLDLQESGVITGI
jgi:hypothetical protein